MLEDFLTLEAISSFPGMVMVVGLLTQFTKKLVDKVVENHTVAIVYFYSIAIIFFTSYARGELTGPSGEIIIQVVMNFLNAVVVALAAMKGYETVLAKVDYNRYTAKMLKKK